MAGRWDNYDGLNGINSSGQLGFYADAMNSSYRLRGVRATRFQATFALRRQEYSVGGFWLMFNQDAKGQGSMLMVNDDATPTEFTATDRGQVVSGTWTSANMPSTTTPRCSGPA